MTTFRVLSTMFAGTVSRRAATARRIARAAPMPPPTVRILAPAVLLFALAVSTQTALAQDYDVIIRNGRVIDGTGNDWFRADIAINGDRIVRIGRMPNATASREIDATGMYVSPGFIDLHSHSDQAMTSEFVEARRAKSLNSQGLTTVVGGADGRNTRWPLSAEIAALRDQGHAMNFVPMVGHSTVRNTVMGNDYERPATAGEIARMQELVRQGMEAGAWGLGAGIEYRPARFSRPEEVVALASEVAPYDGFYVAHQRSEATMPLWQLPSTVDDWPVDGLQGLEETINIARETGIRVVASHHKARGRSSFGRSGHDTLVVNAARADGLEVYLDVYPYETFGGGARPMIPRWSLVADEVDTSGGRDSPVYNTEGMFDDAGMHLTRRWNDPGTRARIARDIAWIVDHNGGADRVVVVDYPDSAFVGKTLTELAGEMGVTFQEVVVHMALNGYPDVLGGAWTRGIRHSRRRRRQLLQTGVHGDGIGRRREWGRGRTAVRIAAGCASAPFRRLHPQDRPLREGPEGHFAAVRDPFDDRAAGADRGSRRSRVAARGVQGGRRDLRLGAAAGPGDRAGAGPIQRGRGLRDGERRSDH